MSYEAAQINTRVDQTYEGGAAAAAPTLEVSTSTSTMLTPRSVLFHEGSKHLTEIVSGVVASSRRLLANDGARSAVGLRDRVCWSSRCHGCAGGTTCA